MGKIQCIRDTPDGDVTISDVKWGPIRRFLYRKDAPRAFGFVPKYELIVTRGLNVMDPICVFHYRDKNAQHFIAAAIIVDGIYGSKIQELLQVARGYIHGAWMPSCDPMVEDIGDPADELCRKLGDGVKKAA